MFCGYSYSDNGLKEGLVISYSHPREYLDLEIGVIRYNKINFWEMTGDIKMLSAPVIFYDIYLFSIPLFNDKYNGNKVNCSLRFIPGMVFFTLMFTAFGTDVQELPLDFVNVILSGGLGFRFNDFFSISIHNYFDPVIFRPNKYLKETHELGFEVNIKSHYLRPSFYTEINYIGKTNFNFGFSLAYFFMTPHTY